MSRAMGTNAGKERPRVKAIWLHFPAWVDPKLVEALCDALLDRDPEVTLIVTGVPDGVTFLDDQIVLFAATAPEPETVDELLKTWSPSALAWLDPKPDTALFAQATSHSVRIHMADLGNLIEHYNGWNLVSRITGARFRHVDTVFVGDTPTRRAVIRAGARDSQVQQVGILERDEETLPFDPDELEKFATILSARPLWLAAKIHFDELGAVIAAHVQAIRRAHRLVLLLVPGDADDGDHFAEVLRQHGLEFCQRSRGETPKSSTQVYLADRSGELGLWYRLAPVSFVGQTIAGKYGEGPDPLGAAALGSAVIHGPMIEHHKNSFTRLSRAGAAYMVAHAGELAYALENFLSPDRAAQLAQAAWAVSTSGADVMNHLVDALIGDQNDLVGDAKDPPE